MSPFAIAIILFAVTYVLLFALPKFRAITAFCSAVVFSLWLGFLCNDPYDDCRTHGYRFALY